MGVQVVVDFTIFNFRSDSRAFWVCEIPEIEEKKYLLSIYLLRWINFKAHRKVGFFNTRYL